MKKAILGTKVGMTQMFREDGTMIPVTVVLAGPCPVVQKKTVAKEGYDAVQVGFCELREKLDLTVVIIEHHMELVMKLCDDICVLNLGALLREGKPSMIQSDPEVIKAYLGERRRRG